MNKVIIHLAGQPMYTEATDEELRAFRSMIARSAYVSWSVCVVGEDEYANELLAREKRASAFLTGITKQKKKWYQL